MSRMMPVMLSLMCDDVGVVDVFVATVGDDGVVDGVYIDVGVCVVADCVVAVVVVGVAVSVLLLLMLFVLPLLMWLLLLVLVVMSCVLFVRIAGGGGVVCVGCVVCDDGVDDNVCVLMYVMWCVCVCCV